MIFKRSHSFRRHHSRHGLAVWVALLAQLHLFFVLQLHHHQNAPVFAKDYAALAGSRVQTKTAATPNPLCPACQIARQCSVHPSADQQALLSLQAVSGTLPLRFSKPYAIFLLRPSGRAPPRA